jgi:hypothetical protein
VPTVAELDRLEALVSRLTPLADVGRGELIRADDWNAVVGALIEVLRAVLADDAATSTPPHEHTDQVAMGWLDPRVRALIERGPLADPSSVSRVDGIDRRIAQAADRMGRLEDTIREARTIASDLSVRDAQRANDIDGVRRRVDALPDARDDITNLRETLSGLQGDVRKAIDTGNGLQVDGHPFDAQALADRVKAVEDLRTRWTAPDGTVFDASALEGRLAELQNSFVTRPALDEVLAAHDATIPDAQFNALQDRLGSSLADRFHADLDHTAADLRGEMAAGLASIDGVVAQKVGDSVGGLSDAILATARSEFTAQLSNARTEIAASIDTAISQAEIRVGTSVDGKLAGMQDQVIGTLQPQIDGRIAAALDPVKADVARIGGQTSAIADAIGRIDAAQTATATRVEVVARADDQGRKALQATLLQELDSRMTQQAATFDARFTQLDATIRDRIDTGIRDATNSLAAQVDQIAGAAAQRESQAVATQMRGEIREIAREEATTAASGIRNDVQIQIDRSNAQLPGLVTGEVRRQTAILPDLVRNEVNARGSGGIGGAGGIGGIGGAGGIGRVGPG